MRSLKPISPSPRPPLRKSPPSLPPRLMPPRLLLPKPRLGRACCDSRLRLSPSLHPRRLPPPSPSSLSNPKSLPSLSSLNPNPPPKKLRRPRLLHSTPSPFKSQPSHSPTPLFPRPRTSSRRRISSRLLTTPTHPQPALPQAQLLTLGTLDRAPLVPTPRLSRPLSSNTRLSAPPPVDLLRLPSRQRRSDPRGLPATSDASWTKRRLCACLATARWIVRPCALAPSA